MPEQIRSVNPPRGLSRILYRLPIYLYRVGLGGLLGERFLLLKHRGRKSGLIREAVIEIIHRDEERDWTYSPAAYGKRSDWYRNLLMYPQVTICIGRERKDVTARSISMDEARAVLRAYADRHATAAKGLARLMGYRIESIEEFDGLATEIPIVVFEPFQATG